MLALRFTTAAPRSPVRELVSVAREHFGPSRTFSESPRIELMRLTAPPPYRARPVDRIASGAVVTGRTGSAAELAGVKSGSRNWYYRRESVLRIGTAENVNEGCVTLR